MLVDTHTIQTATGPQEIQYVIEGYGRKLAMQSDDSWVRPMECNVPAAPGHYIVKMDGVVSIMSPEFDRENTTFHDVYTGQEMGLPIF